MKASHVDLKRNINWCHESDVDQVDELEQFQDSSRLRIHLNVHIFAACGGTGAIASTCVEMALRLAPAVVIGLHVPHHAVFLEHRELFVRD